VNVSIVVDKVATNSESNAKGVFFLGAVVSTNSKVRCFASSWELFRVLECHGISSRGIVEFLAFEKAAEFCGTSFDPACTIGTLDEVAIFLEFPSFFVEDCIALVLEKWIGCRIIYALYFFVSIMLYVLLKSDDGIGCCRCSNG
jgi:hypothetical protein